MSLPVTINIASVPTPQMVLGPGIGEALETDDQKTLQTDDGKNLTADE